MRFSVTARKSSIERANPAIGLATLGNARYKALLNSARDIEDELVAAQITSLSPDPARHVVMLDKGFMMASGKGSQFWALRG
ncbi:MAG: hypothetical protein CM15mP74_00620 [Halieaceae bacterium]|nr:MAG: hypothetical protein CM15mP74_00620 [Halieaceae bacterium]